jgi:ATP-binding cassette subfamily B protein
MRKGRDIFDGMYGSDRPVVGGRVAWSRIGQLFRPYWRTQAIVFLCLLVSAALGLVPGYATARIIDEAIPHRSSEELAMAVCAIVAAGLLSLLMSVLQGYCSSLVGEAIMRDIRTKLVTHLHRVPLAFFTNTKAGEIMNRVLSDVDSIDGVIGGTLTMITTSAIVIVTTVCAMLIWNWRLAAIAIVVVPFMVLPLFPVGRRMYDARKKTREQRDALQAMAQETLSQSGITLRFSIA